MEHLDGIAPADLLWASGTRWYDASLDASGVAAILGIAEGSVRQYASKPDLSPGFPEPVVRASGRPSLWAPDQIFRYIANVRPQIMDRIPRLYCPADNGAAEFLYAEVRYIEPSGGALGQTVVEFVCHVWNPADGRGLIAVAYPGPQRLWGSSWGYAATLLADLPSSITAVALVTDEVVARGGGWWQGAIGVAERGRPALEEVGVRFQVKGGNGRKPVAEMRWDDLSNLLRVDVPFWGPLLRDVPSMTMWRPGAPRQSIRPRDANVSPANLEQLVSAVPPDDVDHVRDLTQRMQRLLEGDEIEVLPLCDRERPGLVQAAEPLHVLPDMPPIPSAAEFRWLLHVPIDDPVIAERASRALAGVRGMNAVVSTVAQVRHADLGRLATTWINELVPVTDAESMELGFAYMRHRVVSSDARDIQYCRHPLDKNCWIVRFEDPVLGRLLYMSLAPQADGAAGILTEFELNGTTAFFRDSADNIWPMPTTGSGYNSGYNGTGPQELFGAVRALHIDAAMDLRDSPRISKDADPLWKFIQTTSPPLAVSASELASMPPAGET